MFISHFQFPGIPAVHCVFTGRGSSPHAGNLSFNAPDALPSRRALLDAARPLGLTAVAECHQVHGTRVIHEPAPGDFLAEAMPSAAADGLITSRPGLGLLIKTADCQPILLCDGSGRHIAAIHCGWRGNRQDFPTLAVRQFCQTCHLNPGEIYAVRGPSLGFAQFDDFSIWGDRFRPWYDESRQVMDLWRLSRAQLQDAGLPPDHIYSQDICTWLNHSHFFSWRRERHQGRQGALIWIAPPPSNHEE